MLKSVIGTVFVLVNLFFIFGLTVCPDYELTNSEEYIEGYNEGYELHNLTHYNKCIYYLEVANGLAYMDITNESIIYYCDGYKKGYDEYNIHQMETTIKST